MLKKPILIGHSSSAITNPVTHSCFFFFKKQESEIILNRDCVLLTITDVTERDVWRKY